MEDIRPVIVAGDPLNVMLTLAETLPDPKGTLMMSGLGLAVRPEPPMVVRLRV